MIQRLALLFHAACLTIWALSADFRAAAAQSTFPAANKNDRASTDALTETSGRLVNEFFEIFALPSDGADHRRRPSDANNARATLLSRLFAASTSKNEDSNNHRNGFPLISENNGGGSGGGDDGRTLSELAQKLIGALSAQLPTTPLPLLTTTDASESFFQRLRKLVPIKNPFSSEDDENVVTSKTTPPPSPLSLKLPPFTTPPPLPPFTTPPTLLPPLIDFRRTTVESGGSVLERLFRGPERIKNEPQIDTGNGDRFVVRENADGGDPLTALLGGKFNERGIEWNNGNMRLVNRQGSKLFGSDLAVHDRSVDIPVQGMFSLANELLNTYRQRQPYD